ncbi:MAG: tyrosine-type recombinase/integrase [Clostridia bacterium]|nr:tyrosine-type recombinase/integrase [Clostridia bacterium]
MGSIEQRGPNSWRVGVQVQTEDGRKWIRRSLKFSDALSPAQQRRQAEKALHQLEADVENGKARANQNMTVDDLAALWMRRHVLANLSPVTAKNYKHLLDRRILPKLGSIPVEKVTPGVIADFMASIKEEGRVSQKKPDEELKSKRRPSDVARLAKNPAAPLSDKTLRTYYDTLYQMFEKAVRWEILWRNPVATVDRPHFRSKPVKYLDDDQAVQLLRALQSEENMSFRCAVLLALTCGLRLGEVGALTWSDVNWKKCTIDISKAAKYTPAAGSFVGDTKSESSDRTITLPAGMMTLLHETQQHHEYLAEFLGDRWRGVGRIVCSWDDSPLHHDTPSKQFRTFADKHGFTGVRFHDLRHTHATLLFASNIDAVAVASRLGHAKADTTLRIYAHVLKRRDEDSATAMQAVLDRAMDSDAD